MRGSVVVHQSARLPVDEVGTGPAVLFVHAGVADRRSWHKVMEIVGTRHRALAYDRRGYGSSAYEPEPHSPADDLLAVLDHAGAFTAALVGCSNGGHAVFEVALRFPERVSALVLIGSAPPGAPQADPGPAADELFDALDEAEASGDIPTINELEARLWLDGPEAPPGRVRGAARRLFLDMNERALTAGPVGDEAPSDATWDRLADLRAPTLVVAGALDVPYLVHRARLMAELIPAAELLVVDGAAHLPMLERAPVVAHSILAFLERASAGG